MLETLLPAKVAIVATSIVAAVVFYVEEDHRGRTDWESYRAAAEKRGVKFFLKDYVGADLPDPENYAAIPLIRDMFAKTPGNESRHNPFALPSKGRPKAVEFFEDKTTSLDQWQTFLIEGKLLKEKSGDAARDVLRGLEKFEPALQQLRETSARPRSKFPTQWDAGFGTPLPHFTPLMAAGRLFTLRMSAHLTLGENAAAYGEFHHALRLHNALVTEPSLIAGLVRISTVGMVAGAVRDGIAAGRWTDPELLAIEKDLGTLHLLDDFHFAISTERGMMNQFLQRLTTAGRHERAQWLSGDGALLSSPDQNWVIALYPDGWILQNMVRANEYFDAILAPYRNNTPTKPVAFIPAIESAKQWMASIGATSGPKRFYYIFLNLLLPAVDSAQAKYLIAHTQVQQTRLGCALERFRKERGSFPAKLDELVPEYISSAPLDVCDGNALRYRRNDDGSYDIWSIGSNRKDDGGIIDPNKTGKDQPDWLWRMPGPTKAP